MRFCHCAYQFGCWVILLLLLVSFFFFSSAASAQAHIRMHNWHFETDLSSWSATNGQGTNVCGNNGTGSDVTLFGSVGHHSNLAGRTAWHAQGGALILTTTNNRVMSHQTFTAPGSGPVRAFGRFRYYATSNGWGGANTSWIRMDLYDSNNSTWIANLGCVSFNSNQAWSHTAPVNIELTGGSTYALRLTMRTQSTAGLSLAAVTTVGMDDVELNFAPVGVTVSQSGTHPQLSWTASVLGTGAPALHSTEAYEVARHTSSPVTTAHLIGHSTTTSYSDQTASGNTTYFYTLFDKDVNGTRSPASQEVSLLTKPVAPVDLNANTLSESSIGLSWQAPPGGAVTYKLQRAPDISGTPGTYIDLVSNHASTSYTDLSLNCSESYWYRVAGQNASGDGVYSSPVLGTTEYCISITLDSDGMVSFGVVPKNTMRNTTAGDLNDSEVVVPTHGPVDLSIKTTAFSSGDDHWSLASTPGHNAVKWQYSITGSEWFEFTQVDSYVPLVQNVSTPTPLFFQLSTPTTSDSLGPYSAGITILATRPD